METNWHTIKAIQIDNNPLFSANKLFLTTAREKDFKYGTLTIFYDSN